jgi:hypothetical protein
MPLSDGFALLPGSWEDADRKPYDLYLVERVGVVAVKHHDLVEILAHDLTYDPRFAGSKFDS